MVILQSLNHIPKHHDRCSNHSSRNIDRSASELQEVVGFSDKSIIGKFAKSSPASANKVAVACSGGKVYVFDMASKNSYKLFDSSQSSPAEVVDLEWDKLSSQYLLIAYDHWMQLWDATSSYSLIQSFDRQSTKVTSICWLDWAPGSFLSANEKTGILKMWNASSKAPMDSIRVTTGGVLSMQAVPNSKLILLAGADGSFQVFHVEHKHVEFKTCTSHSETIFCCAFCPTSSESFATVIDDLALDSFTHIQ